MRRVAAHYLYLSEGEKVHLPVVEVEGNKVVNYYSIENELPVTEWLGGIFILSSISRISISPIDSLRTVIYRLCHCEQAYPLYCWYSPSLNIETKEVEIHLLQE